MSPVLVTSVFPGVGDGGGDGLGQMVPRPRAGVMWTLVGPALPSKSAHSSRVQGPESGILSELERKEV